MSAQIFSNILEGELDVFLDGADREAEFGGNPVVWHRLEAAHLKDLLPLLGHFLHRPEDPGIGFGEFGPVFRPVGPRFLDGSDLRISEETPGFEDIQGAVLGEDEQIILEGFGGVEPVAVEPDFHEDRLRQVFRERLVLDQYQEEFPHLGIPAQEERVKCPLVARLDGGDEFTVRKGLVFP